MAKTIHTILYDDVLDGSKIIEMDNCVCQLSVIRRGYKKNLTPEYELLQGLRGIPMQR